ncbi:MAG: LysE/ArgO family amino acid transporter [Formivibrio sp.]|nr:LysE/ArgO family amino acid transporter [Formivibrio sp.]
MQAHIIAGFLSSLVLIVAIGAQNSFVLRQGIRREHLLPIALFCALADALLIGLGIAGLGALIQNSPIILSITQYAGAGFLLSYAALAGWRAWQGEQLSLEETGRVSLAAAMTACMGFTFLNPHVYLDTVVLLGALANQHGSHGRWLFGAGAAISSFAWFFSLAYGARFFTPLFRKPVAWRVLDLGIASIMLGLAINLLQMG